MGVLEGVGVGALRGKSDQLEPFPLRFEGESPEERAGELQLAARKKNKTDRGAKQSG